jgi:Calcineurin-like phosphoesterase
MTFLSGVISHHRGLTDDVRRVMARLPHDTPDAIKEVLQHAIAHSAAHIAAPLARQPAIPGQVEMNAALVASARGEAHLPLSSSAAPTPVDAVPGAHTSWWSRLTSHLFDHTEPTFNMYADFDARWIYALYERVITTRVPFPAPEARRGPPVIDIPDTTRLAIVGDWGTALPDSDLIGARMVAGNPDYMVHLGDVYYAGTPYEEKRYLAHWPGKPGRSLTLNSNHEMYGGGHGYFGVALASELFALQSGLSYFALRNSRFLVIGLDTAYDAQSYLYQTGALDPVQLQFVHDLVASAGTRQIIVLTHHNGLGLDDRPCEPLWSQLTAQIDRPLLWIWGHIHAGVAHKTRANVLGRCVGHGGIPYEPFSSAEVASYLWAETSLADDAREPCRALNGHYLLDLDGPDLTETFVDERGRARWSSRPFDLR